MKCQRLPEVPEFHRRARRRQGDRSTPSAPHVSLGEPESALCGSRRRDSAGQYPVARAAPHEPVERGGTSGRARLADDHRLARHGNHAPELVLGGCRVHGRNGNGCCRAEGGAVNRVEKAMNRPGHYLLSLLDGPAMKLRVASPAGNPLPCRGSSATALPVLTMHCRATRGDKRRDGRSTVHSSHLRGIPMLRGTLRWERRTRPGA